MEYKPHFASEVRRREPRLHQAPSNVDRRCLYCSRCLNELGITIRLVAKATPGEDDEQQHTDAEDHDIHPLPAPVDKGACPPADDKLRGNEQANQTSGCIAKPMGERGEEHT